MIISHRHKFIFIKTSKTAGTSIEIGPSSVCGPEDIITPISPEDEAIRQKLGHPGPQNYCIPFSSYSKRDWYRFFTKGERRKFYHHKTEPRPSIDKFILSGSANRVMGFDQYSQQSEILVDRVFLFEKMSAALSEIETRLSLPHKLVLPNAKGGYRKDKRSYREIITPEGREKIARIAAREIAHFGYEW